MVRPLRWSGLLLAGAAVLAFAGCGTSEQALPGASSRSVDIHTTDTTPNKASDPQPVDQEAELRGFVAPSGNVSCMVTGDYARCDIIDRDWSPPPRPADCEFDYGQGIAIASGEPASFVCAGDTTFGADDVLAYGDAVTVGSMRCESAESGITCRDTESGHGFSIARQAYRLF